MARRNPKSTNRRIVAPAQPAVTRDAIIQRASLFGYVNPDTANARLRWVLVRDVIAGQDQIKRKGQTYLPMPRNSGDSKEDDERYRVYKERAVFYNATSRTLSGLVGQVFSRDPELKLPKNITLIRDDIDGAGVSLDQQAREALQTTLAMGFSGLYVDYPDTGDRLVSKKDIADGKIGPTFVFVQPENITTWRTKRVDNRTVLHLVVIEEDDVEYTDLVSFNVRKQYRVLMLNENDLYEVRIYRDRSRPEEPEFTSYMPRDASGNHLDFIPFQPIGCSSNNWKIDDSPIYDLAVLNIAHYRNSADYEESCFMVGQPTPWFAGLTQEWVEDVFKGKVYLGSRAAIPLPQGATAGLLQVSPNTLPKEAMDQKEMQMVALGAKLITDTSYNTLGEAQIAESAESSILATVTKNVSAAYTRALHWALAFVYAQTFEQTELFFDLNTDFPASRLTPNERAQVVKEWQDGAITETEMRANLRRAGVAYQDEESYRKERDEHPSPAAKLAQEQVEAEKTAAQQQSKQPPSNNAPNGGNQNAI